MNKLIIAAGTGFLGQVLTSHFRDKFEEVVILTRGKSQTIDKIKGGFKTLMQQLVFLVMIKNTNLVLN
jgi:NAD dependent epimerase/dehydratase family enzyme